MRLLAFAASLRRGSLNAALLEALIPTLRARAEVVVVDYAPIGTLAAYDEDSETDSGLPPAVQNLIAGLSQAEGIVIASPEYNHSLPGSLKNALDWVSRAKPSPLKGRFAMLASASPSLSGGWRGLQALRLPLEAMGCHCHPEVVAVGGVRRPEELIGRLADREVSARVDDAVSGYLRMVESVWEAMQAANPHRLQ